MLITIYIEVKNTKIKDSTSLLKYDLDTLFTIVFMKKNKNRKLSSWGVGENIVSILLNKFFNYFNWIKEDIV